MENTKTVIKRKRGANYTPQETEKLLELISQYRSSIEDKRTGAVYLGKKRETWEKICIAYNSVATSGLRSVDQLKILYDNKKQKTRKVLAQKNNIKTGSGSICPTLTDHDLKKLDLVKDQVSPLPNSCDSAAIYFGDRTCEAQEIDCGSNEGGIRIIEAEENVHVKKQVTTLNIKKKNNINYKQLYFKRKSQNAVLERRKLYQELRFRQKEHNLIIKEHQMRLNFLQKEHEVRMKSFQ